MDDRCESAMDPPAANYQTHDKDTSQQAETIPLLAKITREIALTKVLLSPIHLVSIHPRVLLVSEWYIN
jgi:hypothetical protein